MVFHKLVKGQDGGIFNDGFITNFLLTLMMKEF